MNIIFVKSWLCIICLSLNLPHTVKLQQIYDIGGESTGGKPSLLDTKVYNNERDNDKSSGCGPQVLSCEDRKYRTFDGTCNNLKYPTFGAVNTTYARLMPPRYADGISEPPVSVSGKPLPNPRKLSNMSPIGDIPDIRYTLLAMQWGQFIAHDMSEAARTLPSITRAAKCCTPDHKDVLPKEEQDPRCMPIEISPTDLVYGPVKQLCHNFIRTITDISEGCAQPNKPANQIVSETHYMDLSIIYGTDKKRSDSLREFDGGRLKVDVRNGRSYAPQAPDVEEVCNPIKEKLPCYITGDKRIDQNPQLTILHIVIIREHNRIASVLSELNPHWDDEKLFQETRRILIGMHQYISYYEWLPIFIGESSARKHGLLYSTDGYTDDYDEEVNPSVINEHAAAELRYLHSNIAGHLMLANKHHLMYGELRLSDHFERPMVIEKEDNFDGLIRGMCTQHMRLTDNFFTSEIRNHLFRDEDIIGQDLLAIDIHRGRDHGLASYNEMRKYCGLPSAKKFTDFSDTIFLPIVIELAALYEDPEDVDLVVGGSAEIHVMGTHFGPTFLCILTEQFYRTRAGDRFFFENRDNPYPFTYEQLREIRKASISRLLCNSGDNITRTQPKGFRSISLFSQFLCPKLYPDKDGIILGMSTSMVILSINKPDEGRNPVVSCSNEDLIPVVNLEAWKED